MGRCKEGEGHEGECVCYGCGEEAEDIIVYAQHGKGERMAMGVSMQTTREEIEKRIGEAKVGMEGGVTVKLEGKEWKKQETVRQKKLEKEE